jgi:hypothetical protein
MYGALACFAIAMVLQRFWIAMLIVFLAMPTFWLCNIKCYRCAWPAYRAYGTAKSSAAKDQLFAPMFSRQLWRLPSRCTKCGAPFLAGATNESQS